MSHLTRPVAARSAPLIVRISPVDMSADIFQIYERVEALMTNIPGWDHARRRQHFDDSMSQSLQMLYELQGLAPSQVTSDVLHITTLVEMCGTLPDNKGKEMEQECISMFSSILRRKTSPVSLEYQTYWQRRETERRQEQIVHAIERSMHQPQLLPSAESAQDAAAEDLSSKMDTLTLTEEAQSATNSSSRKTAATSPPPVPKAAAPLSLPLPEKKQEEKPELTDWAEIMEEEEAKAALIKPDMAKTANKGKATAAPPAPKTSTSATVPRGPAEKKPTAAPPAPKPETWTTVTHQKGKHVPKGLSSSMHAPPSHRAQAPAVQKPKEMNFPLITQQNRLAAKQSQQKADHEAALKQNSPRNPLDIYRAPAYKINLADRTKLWRMVAPGQESRRPFEIELESADWCYKHCIGDRASILKEFSALPDFHGLIVWFTDDFKTLVVGPFHKIRPGYEMQTADDMLMLWAMLCNWICKNPTLSMTKGLKIELQQVAEERKKRANTPRPTTNRSSAMQAQRNAYVQAAGSRDAAKIAFDEKLAEAWDALCQKGPPVKTEAHSALQKLVDAEIVSGSPLTKKEMTDAADMTLKEMIGDRQVMDKEACKNYRQSRELQKKRQS